MKLRYLVATAVVPSMFLAACGGGTTSSSASKGTIEIASSFPLQGGDASATIPMLDGVTYAVDTTKSIDGFTLKLVSYDDSVSGLGNADKEAENVNEMIDNPDVLGMIGPYTPAMAISISLSPTERAWLRSARRTRMNASPFPIRGAIPQSSNSARLASTTTSVSPPPTFSRAPPWPTTPTMSLGTGR